jgi:DNA-3-methyladenine glycosylase I
VTLDRPVPEPTRCPWAGSDPLYRAYHDREWGVPVADDRRLFEFLVLEGMQAGLSWLTILRKRENFRRAFAGFDPARVAAFGPAERRCLLADAGIVRNRAKIDAAVANAQAFLALQGEYGSFHGFLHAVAGSRLLINHWRLPEEVPAATALSRELSRRLRERGCRFVGPTICYAFMQAVGLVNDHLTGCFRHREIAERYGSGQEA